MNAGLADNQQAGTHFIQVIINRPEHFAIEQFGFQLDTQIRGDALGDFQMGLVNLGDAVVDQFFMQLFLLLESENLACFIAQYGGDLVEGDIVVIGIVCGDRVDLDAKTPTNIQRRLQGTIGKFRAIDTDDNRAIADGAPGVPDHQGINGAAAYDALTHGADQAAWNRAEAQGPQRQNVKIACFCGLDDLGIIFPFRAQTMKR